LKDEKPPQAPPKEGMLPNGMESLPKPLQGRGCCLTGWKASPSPSKGGDVPNGMKASPSLSKGGDVLNG